MKLLDRVARWLALGFLFTCGACSGSSSSSSSPPSISGALQNRTVDTLGMTVDVTMSEAIKPEAANDAATWTVSAGAVTAAVLQPDNVTVRLTVNAVAVPGDVTIGTVAPTAAAGNVALTGLPADGDTVTISDGTTAVTFEFTSGLGAMPGNVEVVKGVDATATVAVLIVAINLHPFLVTAAPGAGDSTDLTNDDTTADGNVLLTEADMGAVITLTGMAGGGGLEDLSGASIAGAVAGVAIASQETLAPTATTLAGLTVEGADNDQLTVVFDDDMLQSEVENVANWVIESPIGTGYDPTNATVSYDIPTRTATVMLGTGTVGTVADANNLQTFEAIGASFTTMRDVAGNTIAATTIGVDAVAGTVTGDDEPPRVLFASADDVATTLDLSFSEPTKAVAFGDLYSGGTDDGLRLILTDPDNTPAVAATGSVALSGDPTDGDTVTIDDGVTSVTFEYDNNVSVGGGNVAVTIAAADTVTTTANLQAAVAGSALTITAVANVSSCDLTHNTAGVAGNIAITEVEGGAVITVTGMAGGADAVSADITPVATLYAWDADGLGATVDYDPVVPSTAADTLEIYGVQDLAGNQMIPLPGRILVTPVGSTPALSTGNSNVTAVSNESNDVIQVRFAQAMSPFNILDPANYTAAPLDLSTASFDFDGTDLVTITLDDATASDIAFGAAHNLTLVANPGTELRTAYGVALAVDDVEAVVAGGDNTGVTMAGTSTFVAPVANPNGAIVTFPEAVDMTSAMTLTNYTLSGSNPTLVEELTPNAVRLTFATQPMAAQTLTIEAAGATDRAGNPAVAQMMIALGVVDAVAPTATLSATSTSNQGGDEIAVAFDAPVDLVSALDASNYALTEGGGPIDLTGATLRYESGTNSVVFELPEGTELGFGAMIGATLTGVTDVSGNALAVQPTDVATAGDNTAPNFLGAGSAYINWIEDNTGLTVDVYFDEDVDATFVGTPGNWSTNPPMAGIASTTPITPRMVRVVTTSQLAFGENLQLTGLPDLAGNTSGMISINPQE